ncbi:unnamed protein product [Adineta steineri]|uniref:Uncharacterized protein n=1 Tax=Adineta steineri TaxID=433720 RepID=A0A815RXF5_9BILA|nr:unnamed protein product [Adineta steineri]CAF1439239.1 unnamed protein product [Adineta steineri]CAF1480774.1 unnamed protein product [Adineta steineri]CAF3651025.1 unnamed protein product [Adineta steineri]CAF3802377.1 unnamed protein product [Adineta steineri]
MRLFLIIFHLFIFSHPSSSWFTGGRRRSSTCREYFGHEAKNKLLLVNLEPIKSDLRADFRSYTSSASIPSYKKIRFINHCCFIFPSNEPARKTDMEFYGRRQRLLEIGERNNKKQITIPSDLDENNILLYTKDNRLIWAKCADLERETKTSCDSYWLKGCLVREHGPYTWYCNLTEHISYTDDIPSITTLQAGSDFMERHSPSMKKSC